MWSMRLIRLNIFKESRNGGQVLHVSASPRANMQDLTPILLAA